MSDIAKLRPSNKFKHSKYTAFYIPLFINIPYRSTYNYNIFLLAKTLSYIKIQKTGSDFIFLLVILSEAKNDRHRKNYKNVISGNNETDRHAKKFGIRAKRTGYCQKSKHSYY